MITQAPYWIALILFSVITISACTIKIYRKSKLLLPVTFIVSIVFFQLFGSIYQVTYLASDRPLFFSGEALALMISGLSLSVLSYLCLYSINVYRPLSKIKSRFNINLNGDIKLRNQIILDLIIASVVIYFLYHSGYKIILSVFNEPNYVKRLELRNSLFFNSPNSRLYLWGMITLPAFSLGLQAAKFRSHNLEKLYIAIPRTIFYFLVPCLSASKGAVLISSTIAIIAFLLSGSIRTNWTRRNIALMLTLVVISFSFFSFAATNSNLYFDFLFRIFGVYSESHYAIYDAWVNQIQPNADVEAFFHQYMYFFPGHNPVPALNHYLLKYGLVGFYSSCFVIPMLLAGIEKTFETVCQRNNPVFTALLTLVVYHTLLLATMPPPGTVFSKTYIVTYILILLLFFSPKTTIREYLQLLKKRI